MYAAEFTSIPYVQANCAMKKGHVSSPFRILFHVHCTGHAAQFCSGLHWDRERFSYIWSVTLARIPMSDRKIRPTAQVMDY